MQQVIMYIMAAGAVLGGIDYLLGNRLKLGEQFKEGFMLLGPTALSMAGILCLAPVISDVLGQAVSPLFAALGLDPAMFAGILSIDMGGYTMATRLAADPAVGVFAGIVVSAILGCTLVFTIPVGMGMLDEASRPAFARGVLWGLAVMPLPLWLGGVLCGLGALNALWQLMPVIVLCGLLIVGLWKKPNAMIRLFQLFARLLEIVIIIGLIVGAVQYMTGLVIIPGLMPLEEAMGVVSAIGIVLLGSLPVATLFTRLLNRPLERLGGRLGLNAASMAGFLLCAVSLMPVIATFKRMDRRGQVANAAAAVCSTAALAAHLGFAASQQPDALMPLLAAKLIGAVLAAAVALMATRRQAE